MHGALDRQDVARSRPEVVVLASATDSCRKCASTRYVIHGLHSNSAMICRLNAFDMLAAHDEHAAHAASRSCARGDGHQ